jgi:hypothetical protein
MIGSSGCHRPAWESFRTFRAADCLATDCPIFPGAPPVHLKGYVCRALFCNYRVLTTLIIVLAVVLFTR